MPTNPHPSGYYLKKTDNLLTQAIDHIQATFGINRLQWQMLHSVQTQPHNSRSSVFGPLLEFDREETLTQTLSALLEKNSIREDKGLLLTESGQEIYTACWQKQVAFRQQSMAGITEADYLH